MLTFPRSRLIADVIPSPRGGLVAMVGGGCATSFSNQHLIVRNLRMSKHWSVGADTSPCHVIGQPSWSQKGSQLIFPYGPSTLSSHPRVPPPGCPQPRPSRLAVVPAGRTTPISSWKLIMPDRGCSFTAAAFDTPGIAAVEQCHYPNFGPVYLLQLNQRDHIVARLPLKRNWEDGLAATEKDGHVLVTEAQPANEGPPPRDWVWDFDGHQLRLIASYHALDADQVIAIPW